ncbi:FKPC1-like protein [Mya arenaria]|uniref:FKPC1-like protein n=1 Tax=Mya arenaria TaxID=6604 RepID=A0ABY7G418_MYAAR|nr:FKPC1-like protein [Mya arenaria]
MSDIKPIPYALPINESHRFSNTWLLQGHVTEEEVRKVSSRIGFDFLQKLPTNHFVLRRGDVPHRSRRKYSYNNSLHKALNLTFIKQEQLINVSLRQIMDPQMASDVNLSGSRDVYDNDNYPLPALRMIGPNGVLPSGQVIALTTDVDVSSNSWGGTDGSFEGPSQPVKEAFVHGTSSLRGGKGVIYVFAGGNGGFDDNCNMDGYVNSIYTIGINGVARDLEPPGYAEPCSAVMASAYTGKGGISDNLCTTDVNGGCINSLSGKSAAAPLAAGALALVLGANQNLHWRDMQQLLIETAK